MAGLEVVSEASHVLDSETDDISDQRTPEEEINVHDTCEESDQPAREEGQHPETDFPDVTLKESEGKDIENAETQEVNETVPEGSDEQDENNENAQVNVTESQGSDEQEKRGNANEGNETEQGEIELSEGQGAEVRTSEPNSEHHRLLQLPMSRIKNIIKMDPDVTLASQEAVVSIAKAAELFITEISRDACHKTIQGRRRIVMRKDLDHVMDVRDCYAFLEGAVDD